MMLSRWLTATITWHSPPPWRSPRTPRAQPERYRSGPLISTNRGEVVVAHGRPIAYTE